VTVRAGAAEGRVEVIVRDTGVGIDANVRDRIFDPFVQGDRTLARSGGGLGLGLALVKGLARLHGGDVAVASEGPGRGAEFRVWIPASAGAETRPPADVPRADGARRRVLVVDDNRDAAESLAELVAAFGHEVEIAHDGPTALARARATRHDFVLCDIGLPGMSGYDVARALRSSSDGALLVAVTGYALPEDRERAAQAGFDAHLAKPPDPEELERLLLER
jgi:CheY-like chemotaxis protein